MTSSSASTQLILDFTPKPPTDLTCVSDDLELLSLRGCCEWATDEILEQLSSSGQIKTAYFFRCWRLTDRGLYHFLKRHGDSLLTLDLSGCSHITDKTLQSIQRFCPRLRDLDLTRCVRITDIGINYITDRKDTLESLLLYADAQLTSSAYSAIAQLSQLRRLDLCGHENLETKQLIDILNNCTGLEYLNLTWCVRLTDEVLTEIVQNDRLAHVSYLSLFGLKGFSAKPVHDLVEYLSSKPRLHELDLRAIPSAAEYTVDDCKLLRERIPHLVEWKLHH